MAAVVKQRSKSGGQRTRVGIALSGTSMCAVFAPAGESRPRVWHTTLGAPPVDASPVWPELVDALRALSRASGVQDGSLAISLMPSLAEVRSVQLPPVGDEALQQLLARNAGKYFLTARGAQILGIVPRGTDTTSRIVAAASSRLLTVVHASAETSGWRVDAMHPAEAAWGAAAVEWGKGEGNTAQLLVATSAHVELLQLDRGQLAVVRRFREGTQDLARIAEACTAQGGLLLLAGSPAPRAALSNALAARGVTARTPAATSADLVDDADALAAAYASTALAPALLTDAVRAQRARHARTLTTRFAVAAGLLLLLAGALQLWDVRRELAVVRAERDALRPQLSATLVGRTTVETAFRQLAVLAEAGRDAPQWSAVLGGISAELPLESYLTGFRGRADTVGIDGLALYAARVFDAVEQVPQLSGVRASAPVRRETSAEGEALERFQLTALLKRTAADSASGGAR
jgi:hypothetical protein